MKCSWDWNRKRQPFDAWIDENPFDWVHRARGADEDAPERIFLAATNCVYTLYTRAHAALHPIHNPVVDVQMCLLGVSSMTGRCHVFALK